LHDPADRIPAVRGFYADGRVHYEERYFAGQRNDARDGSAAVRKWRHDGTLRHELHYAHGRRLREEAVAPDGVAPKPTASKRAVKYTRPPAN
jgi:hypothetical protein